MSTAPLRTFVAISLPAAVQHSLYQFIAPLRAQAALQPIRWVREENLHLTLKFLGDVSPRNLEILASLIEREAMRYRPFFIRLDQLGVFPNPHRPRVLWVGLHAPNTLYSLQKGVEKAAAQLGYTPDRRPFHPHITLGRLRQPVNFKTTQALTHELETFSIPPLGDIRVTHVTIYTSRLTPQGPIYTPKYQHPLKT